MAAQSFPPLKFTDFWTRKIRTYFRRLDRNGRGCLTMDDCLEVTSTILAENTKMSAESEDCLVKRTIDLWVSIFSKHMPTEYRVSGRVNEIDFIRNFKELANDAAFRDRFERLMVSPYFKAVDTDNDGLISQAEYRGLMVALRAPPQNAQMTFKSFEVNKTSGKLNLENFTKGLAEFFFGEEQRGAKFTLLWGPLVSYKRPEDFPELECKSFWEGKMRTMFRRLDVSGNGSLKSDDFIEIGKNLAHRGHLDKAHTNILIKAMLDIWVKFFGMDKDGTLLDSVGEKVFIRNLRERINTDFRHEIDQLGWAFFKAVEVDGNGVVSLQEYRNLQEAWNVAREEADGMFKALDTDKDGKVTTDEYLAGWCDYFLGEDPNSIYKSFFGPTIIRHMDHR